MMPIIPLYQTEHLTISTDTHPIGGFRGKEGTLQIEHKDRKHFTEWDPNELKELSHIIQKTISIYQQANIHNILIFAKQDGSQTKFNLIPYPRCNWLEKIQGSIHAIFGGLALSHIEQQQVSSFFSEKFANAEDSLPQELQKPQQIKPDVFCNPSIIQKQLITDISLDGKIYHLMHDITPKGRILHDPHLLIVPDEHEGHLQNSDELAHQRLQLLTIAQRATQILLNEGSETVLLIERIGSKLQGVQHTHVHAIGIDEFPKTFVEKCKALFRLTLPSKLSSEQLQDRIFHYQYYEWLS